MGLSLLSSNERGMDWSMKNEDVSAEKWIARGGWKEEHEEGGRVLI